ncbi:hypothetical protein B2G71_04815 [Novosphingobium sp. PC22D]|nr:hypothetical protein B2G71_04815 [Novosphingobium sp. PC22D]
MLAEFDAPRALVEGAGTLRGDGWRIETFSPFPLDGLGDAIGFSDRAVPVAVLVGAVLGAALIFAIQAGANLDYPLDVGGRPLVTVPGFLLVTLECGILGAVLAGIGTMLARNGLPRLHHPLFNAERFSLASDDRFFLAILVDGDADRAHDARAALWRCGAVDVVDVGEQLVA